MKILELTELELNKIEEELICSLENVYTGDALGEIESFANISVDDFDGDPDEIQLIQGILKKILAVDPTP